MLVRIPHWSHLILDFCLQGICVFLITDSISLLVISLFKLSISFWFSFGGLYVSRNLYISSRFPICWHIIVHRILIFVCLFVCLYCCGINCYFSPLIFCLFGSSLFSSWWAWPEVSWFFFFLNSFKEPAVGFINFFYYYYF